MTNSRTGDTTGSKAGKPSGAWWLLPVLFGVVGGIFAWTAIKGKDSELAWRMFALGLLITVFVISFIISNDGFPSFSDFSFE
ncbi:hypothetical protein ABFB09_02085 [Dehalogenimonas sp. THU2]|uniref:hypothetical protein n=1 Tax=Dehalogenimonas sp. THU2 TaxID=3151121 RepID=UPI003218D19C